jgi:hypothetical protein
VVVIKPYYDNNGVLKIEEINSGVLVNGQASVTTYDATNETQLRQAAEIPYPHGVNAEGEPFSGGLNAVKIVPPPPPSNGQP